MFRRNPTRTMDSLLTNPTDVVTIQLFLPHCIANLSGNNQNPDLRCGLYTYDFGVILVDYIYAYVLFGPYAVDDVLGNTYERLIEDYESSEIENNVGATDLEGTVNELLHVHRDRIEKAFIAIHDCVIWDRLEEQLQVLQAGTWLDYLRESSNAGLIHIDTDGLEILTCYIPTNPVGEATIEELMTTGDISDENVFGASRQHLATWG